MSTMKHYQVSVCYTPKPRLHWASKRIGQQHPQIHCRYKHRKKPNGPLRSQMGTWANYWLWNSRGEKTEPVIWKRECGCANVVTQVHVSPFRQGEMCLKGSSTTTQRRRIRLEVECRSGAELSVSPRQHEKRNGTVCGRSQIDVCGPPQSHPGKATLTFNTFNQ